MITKVVPGLLIATPDAAQAAKEACARIVKGLREAIRDRGEATLALSGGSSPLDAYRLLAQETIDWNKVNVYWVDDRGVPPTHERSNFGAAKKALIDPASIPDANVHRMRGEASDLSIAAMDYEAELRDTVKAKLGGVPALDVVVLGVGDDGHTASLFPHEKTHEITDKLVAAVPAREGREARLTLTTPVLENARNTVILVLGKSKNPALEKIWATHGDIDETPGRVIRSFRGAICWVIDRAAGGMG
ncbi:MAG: 6-phosphogluconolactonase [Deltaproteobacteria bacterium]|nr:6-phosphogluconolactonase [Deltaproteobacteria bacterium]